MSRRQAHLNALVMNDGYHESAWLVLDQDPAASATLDHYVDVARTTERGLFDSIFFADRPGLETFRAGFFPQVGFDPLDLVAALASVTTRLGLIATASTTYNAPYDLARRIATVDHLSGGRAGWNVVTTSYAATAKNFGTVHPEHEDRYARAGEFVDVVRALWDTWDDDAVVADRASGVWAEPGRIRPAGFHGDYYDVAGALPVPRSPQGHPVLAQAGSSDAGIDLAGRVASLVFTPQPTVAAGRAFRDRLQKAAANHGRPADSVLALPGLAFVLGSTEAEARARRADLEDRAKSEFRWRNLAYLAGLDLALIEPDRPLSAEAISAAPRANSTTARVLEIAERTGQTFREIADEIAVLPGQLEFTGTPEQLADLVEEWVTEGASDGFTLLPTTLPDSLALFVDHVVPLLQERGLHRREYTGTTLRDHLGLPRPDLVSTRARG
ncbi:NtaA/DmoA family FMN-dependent monooxygenase [Mumia sp. DW29H23]|uniref:NtaA/DmoA family FMN-dependent monooxygenase n=1 Tax=Mumia sp. DW29H23 TaxID=3421241 RepID=UPI003D69C03D